MLLFIYYNLVLSYLAWILNIKFSWIYAQTKYEISVKKKIYVNFHKTVINTIVQRMHVLTWIYRYAVVTGANKGIGYGICKKLALNGIVVVLTARNEKRGLEAVERLKEFGLSDFVVFHQLDVTDPSSVTSLSHFIKTRFGKLDILVSVTISFPPFQFFIRNLSQWYTWVLQVNNAGVPGGIVNAENYLRRVRFHVICIYMWFSMYDGIYLCLSL